MFTQKFQVSVVRDVWACPNSYQIISRYFKNGCNGEDWEFLLEMGGGLVL